MYIFIYIYIFLEEVAKANCPHCVSAPGELCQGAGLDFPPSLASIWDRSKGMGAESRCSQSAELVPSHLILGQGKVGVWDCVHVDVELEILQIFWGISKVEHSQ